MTQQTSPFLEGKYGWNYGESGWNTGMDENLLKFSFMFDKNVDGIVSSLPSVVNGQAYFLTTDKRLYFAVGTTWYSSPTPKWFTVILKSSGAAYQFDGTNMVASPSVSGINTRVTAIEATLATLGTAAYQNSTYFATQSALDVASAQAATYSDSVGSTIRSDLANTTDYTKGVSQVGGAVRSVDTVAILRTLPATVTVVDLNGYYVKGDKKVIRYYYDATDTTSTDNGGSILVSSNAPGRYKTVFGGAVNIRDWGAKCDGTTDDTIAVQRAITYCSSFPRWPSLLVPGRTRLTASLIVDRPVDTTPSEWLIQGVGPAGGFYASTAITMFDSSLTITTDPRSEWITFQNLQFESSSVGLAVYVLSKAFLRIKNINCNYRLLRYCTSTIYMQTHYFLSCNIRNNPTPFIDTAGCYDISFGHGVIENGNTFLRSLSTTVGTVGVRIHDSVIEGIQSTVFIGTGIHGFVYDKIHSEGNFSPELNFWGGSLRNHSVSVTNGYFINPAGPVVAHGPTDAAYSQGNYVLNAFHSTLVQVTNFTSMCDNTGGALADVPIYTLIGGLRSKNPTIFTTGVGTTVTPTIIGQMTLQFTSNTQATIKGMGSDGVVRSGNITLA